MIKGRKIIKYGRLLVRIKGFMISWQVLSGGHDSIFIKYCTNFNTIGFSEYL